MLNQSASDIDTTPVIEARETFDGTWHFEAHYSESPGFSMHYVDEGEGPDTLLILHGEPTWGYLFRHQITAWAEHARVIAPDHMGFGKSATPQDRSYWLQDHINNIEALVLDLDLRNITLVLHDFGGPVGIGFATRHPDRVKQIVSINAPLPFDQPDLTNRLSANTALSPWFQWIMQAESDGSLEQILGYLSYNVLSTMKLNGFERNEIITDAWIKAYSAPFPNPQQCAGAIGWAKGFATGMHIFEAPDSAAKRAITAKPALAIWGENDRTLNASQFLPLFQQLFPAAAIRLLPDTGHYSPEDAPLTVGKLVREFINTTSRRSRP